MKVDLNDLNNALDSGLELHTINGNTDYDPGQSPFEGPEKLLEIWFAPCYTSLSSDGDLQKSGLRAVPGSVWEDMLEIVKCKVLSVVHGKEIDAYLLRFVPVVIRSHDEH